MTYMPTNSANLVKIGPVSSEIFGLIGYVDFCRIVAKVIIFNIVIFGVTRPNLTKVLHNAKKCMSFNLIRSEVRYSNPFRYASTTNENMLGQNGKFGNKIGCHSNVLWAIAIWMASLSSRPKALPLDGSYSVLQFHKRNAFLHVWQSAMHFYYACIRSRRKAFRYMPTRF